jgi:nicotinamidase-related amidase
MDDTIPPPLPACPLSPDLRVHWYNSRHYSSDSKWKGLEPSRAALVLVDLINWQAHPDGASLRLLREAGAGEQADYLLSRCEKSVIPNLGRVLAAARTTGVRVVHARLASRHPDFTDIVPALRPYVRAAGAIEGSWGTEALSQLGPDAGDLSVVKTGSGAFTSSELDTLLRRFGVDTILYAGVVTSACVMLTAAVGFDLGYRQFLISDCTASLSDHDQSDAERLLGVYVAEIVSASEVVTALKALPVSPSSK